MIVNLRNKFTRIPLQRGPGKLFFKIIFTAANVMLLRNSLSRLFLQRTLVIKSNFQEPSFNKVSGNCFAISLPNALFGREKRKIRFSLPNVIFGREIVKQFPDTLLKLGS